MPTGFNKEFCLPKLNIKENKCFYIDFIINGDEMNPYKIKFELFSYNDNMDIKNYMLQLSIETYYFSTIKDMAILKQEISNALLKEGIANTYNGTVGTQNARNNQAIVDNLDKQTVNMLYNAVSNNMKSKLDEAHRMINVLQNILISNNAEAKLKVTSTTE